MELKFDVGVNIAIGLIQFPPMSALFDKSPVSRLSRCSSSALEGAKAVCQQAMCVMYADLVGMKGRHHSSFLHLFGQQLFQLEVI